MSVIVYGTQGCGMTQHAQEIMEAYGCVRILDPWSVNEGPGPSGTLHLTNFYIPGAIPFDSAMAHVALCKRVAALEDERNAVHDIRWALRMLLDGLRICRSGMPRGAYIFIPRPDHPRFQDDVAFYHWPEGYMGMTTPDEPWTATLTYLSANDWRVYP